MRLAKQSARVAAVLVAILGAIGIPDDVQSWGSLLGSLGSEAGRWVLVAAGLAGLLLIQLGPKLRSGRPSTPPAAEPDSADGTASVTPTCTPRQRAFRMIDELRRGRGLIDTALARGQWWDTGSDGIHDEEWQAGQDAMADTAPLLRATVGSAYADGVRVNREANAANSRLGPAPPLERGARERLEALKVSASQAIEELRKYCQGEQNAGAAVTQTQSRPSPGIEPLPAVALSPPALKPSTVLSALRDVRRDGELLLRAARDPLGGYATFGRVVNDATVQSWEANVKHLLRDDTSRLSLFTYDPLAPVGRFTVELVDS